ncbi:TPA: hypothetical protein ACGE2L_002184 [Acinetobacter baumannii]|uniref:hypothetical protein n=1 Tax=Acinetobacter baumannii TaxID=470 RepID=UPI00214874C7|nr:hypothetical protein [Acinetobacter baumannii]MCQ9992134.1 hypothetical protein [Acinetobacter baumannii]HCQ9655384.1 hypothetical protein [Acinetobacter baumannii]
MKIINPYQIFIDQINNEKSTAHIDCHPFIFSIGIFKGNVRCSYGNAIVEDLAKQYVQVERVDMLANTLAENILAKYSDRCITRDLIESIQKEINWRISSFCGEYPDFDQFYRASIIKK